MNTLSHFHVHSQTCHFTFRLINVSLHLCARFSGEKFLCSEVIAPIRSEVDDISLIIINFEDLSSSAAASVEKSPVAKNRLSKCR